VYTVLYGESNESLASRVGFCAASFEYFDFSLEFVACSLPVLSAQKPWFSQSFSRFWQVPSVVCSAHAGSVHGACGVEFRVALPQASRFSSRAGSPKNGGIGCPPLARSTPVEGTGRQLNFLSLGWPEKASPGSGLVFGVERRRGHTTCRGRPSTTGPFVDF
jgi:hypothetical protein